jgi:GDP-4-dehydro-6-deoxy-D-mannose reductase
VKIAVSGVNGFVGSHLVADLVRHGHDVVGLGRGEPAANLHGRLAGYHDQDLSLAWPDLPDLDAVVHLAGLSAVGPSFADPQSYLSGNSAPVTHLGESLLASGLASRVVVVSTGAVYAPGTQIAEADETRVSSPYAMSKLLVELQCTYYRSRGLDITVMRPFNHLGPGQQKGFLLPDLVAGVTAGRLVVGNLDTRRDYTDVRDVVRAYRLAVESREPLPPVLNVCSGVSVSGRELLDLVLEQHGTASTDVRVDPALVRPGDPAEISGDNGLIARTLSWQPELPLADTVRDTLAAR